MNIQTKYFLLAIVFAGSSGVWLPILVEYLSEGKVTYHSIPQNVTTYFVSLAFAGCIDLFISKLKSLELKGVINHFINIVLIIIISIAIILSAVILSVKNQDNWALVIGIIGLIMAYRIWWISNIDNPNFTPKAVSVLGGNPDKKLSNG